MLASILYRRYCLFSSFSGKLINFVQKVQFRGIAQTENRRGSDLDCTKVKTVQMYFVKYTLNITHIISTHIWIAQTRLVIEGLSSSMRRKDLQYIESTLRRSKGELAKLMGMC